MKTLATFLLNLKLSLHMLARHLPNYLLPALEPSMTFNKSLCKSIYFSKSLIGNLLSNSSSVMILVSNLINAAKLGELYELPISGLFSWRPHKGDFLPNTKSQTLSMILCLNKNSKPKSSYNFTSSGFYYFYF
jgi:hypothetical protein